MNIDDLYYPWEKDARKRERQRRTAAVPKCCGCNQRTHHETGFCTTCRKRHREAERKRVLDGLADRILDAPLICEDKERRARQVLIANGIIDPQQH